MTSLNANNIVCIYSKMLCKRTHDLVVQADFVVIYQVFSAKSAWKMFQKLLLKIKYYIDYHQMKAMCKPSNLIAV